MEAVAGHPDWVGDPARIANELGWRATTTLEDGLTRTAAWLREAAPAAQYGG